MRVFVASLLLFLSGIALWDLVEISWEIKRVALLVHVPLSIYILLDLIAPFAYKHTRYFLPKFIEAPSNKGATGVVLLSFFAISIVSGIYLMFVGNRGEMVGSAMQFVHLWVSFLILASFIVHAKKLFVPLLLILSFNNISLYADTIENATARGEKLFFTAGKTSVAGLDMGKVSCASCHTDGFNESNKILFQNAKIDRSKDAVIGHKTIKNFFAHDFVADYIEAIIEQGGEVKNPSDPAIIAAMGEMHLYIRSSKNLPYFSNWVLLDENITTYKPHEWLSSANCATCHPDSYREWANSNHRLMGGSNPYYMVLEDLAAKTEGEGFRFWCMGCHSPTQMTSGARETNRRNLMFDKDGEYLLKTLNNINKEPEEGASCLFCHRITAINDISNASYTINLRDRKNYIFEERDGLLGFIHEKQINAKADEHIDSYTKDIYKDSKYCATCHNEFSPGKGVMIVETYDEWKNSPFNKGADNPETKTCIDCHMHKNPSDLATKPTGKSTVGGKHKENLRSHHFVGSNHFLIGLRDKEHEKLTIDLLKTSAKISLIRSDEGVKIEVKNIGAGHHLPTGVADFRELWLEVKAVDSSGEVVIDSGFVDSSGEVEASAKMFKKVFGDSSGKPVGLAFWRYEKLLSDTRIPAGKSRVESFKFSKKPHFPITVTAKLNFRIYPQWVTTIVQKSYPDLPTPPIVTLNILEESLK